MLGEQIKKLREVRKLSQVELAHRIGVSKQSVSNWENNNIMPSVDLIIKISEYFSCTSDFLLELDNKGFYISTDGLNLKQIALLQEIADSFRELNNDVPK